MLRSASSEGCCLVFLQRGYYGSFVKLFSNSLGYTLESWAFLIYISYGIIFFFFFYSFEAQKLLCNLLQAHELHLQLQCTVEEFLLERVAMLY